LPWSICATIEKLRMLSIGVVIGIPFGRATARTV
jgi:hypothetical protein